MAQSGPSLKTRVHMSVLLLMTYVSYIKRQEDSGGILPTKQRSAGYGRPPPPLLPS